MQSLESAKKNRYIQPSAVISQHESFNLHEPTEPLGGAVKLVKLEWKFLWEAHTYWYTFIKAYSWQGWRKIWNRSIFHVENKSFVQIWKVIGPREKIRDRENCSTDISPVECILLLKSPNAMSRVWQIHLPSY